jgi:hypothetical protein
MTQAARPAGFDTDNDGMSDAWETAHGLNPSSAADGSGDYNGDGYTNLEKYLNSLADDACAGSTPTNPTETADAGNVSSKDAAVPVADASVPPGKDSATAPGPDAFVPVTDTASARPDAGDGSTVRADTAGSGSDATTSRPDAAIPVPDVAAPLADTAPTLTNDVALATADAQSIATADAPPAKPNTPDASLPAPKPPTAPADSPKGCSISRGSALSNDHLGLLSLLAGALLLGRNRNTRRRKAAGKGKS